MRLFTTLCLTLCLAVSSASAQVVPDQYIVVLKDSAPSASGRAIAAQHRVAVGHEYRAALKGFSFHGNAQAAAAIAKHPQVAYVEANLEAHAVAQILPEGVDRMEIDLNAIANIDGIDDRVNVDVAVIDTGIDLDHPDLPQVVGGAHFYTISSGRPRNRGSFQDNNYDDDEGHGTHVAGTIAALDNNIGVVGVVPGARLWAIKVLDSQGSGTFADIIKGIDFVTAHADEIEVANMSLSGQGTLNSLRTAIQNSVAAGVVYVVAASNDSMDVYGPDGVYGTNDDVIPAAYPEVATISAMGDTDGQSGGAGSNTSYSTGDDTFANFTNFSTNVAAGNPVTSPGAAIDVAGPGVDVLSTYPGGYATGSGTSMASPHVAGLVALEVATNGRANNAADVYAIRQAIIDSAQPQADWGPANTFDPDANAEGLAVAVSAAPNDAPVVSITSPSEGDTVGSGVTVTLTATASDTEDDFDGLPLVITWSSDVDGALAPDANDEVTLSDALHTLTASVSDSGGKTRTDSVSILVGDPPTVAEISSVDSIAYETYGGKSSSKNLRVTLTIRDDFDALVSGATVDIQISVGGTTYTGTGGTTASDGTVAYTLRNARSGVYTTVVTKVEATDLTWDGTTPTNSFSK